QLGMTIFQETRIPARPGLKSLSNFFNWNPAIETAASGYIGNCRFLTLWLFCRSQMSLGSSGYLSLYGGGISLAKLKYPNTRPPRIDAKVTPRSVVRVGVLVRKFNDPPSCPFQSQYQKKAAAIIPPAQIHDAIASRYPRANNSISTMPIGTIIPQR